MTLDDKLAAVEEFVRWREDEGRVDPLDESLPAFRLHLQAQAYGATVEDARGALVDLGPAVPLDAIAKIRAALDLLS